MATIAELEAALLNAAATGNMSAITKTINSLTAAAKGCHQPVSLWHGSAVCGALHNN